MISASLTRDPGALPGADSQPTIMKPRTVIIDDHTLLAEAFKKLLEGECEVVGTYGDARQFLLEAARLNPDIVLLDLSMPMLNGLDAARELKRLVPASKIIFLTMNEDPDIAAEAFRVGASGYLLKRSAASELHQAVREVMNQRYYITPLLTKELVGSLMHESPARKPVHQLTSRQREVLQLLAEGRSMKEVAAILNVSARTVAFHKYRMMETLHVDSTAALIQFAVREGLV
jgi:DNA-binding NarL/FixJ family response regulator